MATFGASAPASHTLNYDALLTTTLMNYRAVMVDNIFKSNAFLAALRKYDGIDYQSGGERIQKLLMYEANDTVKSYEGYEQITVKPQDGMTSAFYRWAEIAGTISISRREERQNSDEAKILSLLEQKTKQAEMAIKAEVNRQIVEGYQNGTAGSQTIVPGNDAKDLFPLGYFLPKANATAAAAGGNVGGLSRATYSWWRPRTAVLDSGTLDTGNSFALSVSTWKGLEIALKRMWNYCSRGGDGSGPNICLMNQETYEQYESGLNDKVRYTDTGLADMGFDNVRLKGAACIWDELVPNLDEGYFVDDDAYKTNNKQGTAFFLNTNFFKLTIDEESDFVTTPFVEPENQTAKTAKILFMGNTTCSNMRKIGVCYAISNTIVS